MYEFTMPILFAVVVAYLAVEFWKPRRRKNPQLHEVASGDPGAKFYFFGHEKPDKDKMVQIANLLGDDLLGYMADAQVQVVRARTWISDLVTPPKPERPTLETFRKSDKV